MDSRISMAVAAAVVAAMPLLAGCGPSEPATGSSGASANGQAALPSASAAAGREVSAPTSPPASASSDSAQDRKRVRAASETFVTTVLTIGYPDKKFGDYTDRIKPLMTADGFTSLRTAASATKGTAALKSLYAQRARSAPKLSGAAKVTSLEDGRASAQIAYENQAQQKSGSGWKTIKSLGKGTVTVKLVKQDGKWLVEEAS
jgi:hypothetical protein